MAPRGIEELADGAASVQVALDAAHNQAPSVPMVSDDDPKRRMARHATAIHRHRASADLGLIVQLHLRKILRERDDGMGRVRGIRSQASVVWEAMRSGTQNVEDWLWPRVDGPRALKWTYFIAAVDGARGERFIKIGVASAPDYRLQELQLVCPLELRLLAAFPDILLPERDLHKRFADARLRAEWFRPTARLKRLIDEVAEVSPFAPTVATRRQK